MKKCFLAGLVLFLPILVGSATSNANNKERVTTDEYVLTLKVKVPRVYDNTKSLGYRKYQSQTIKGKLKISYRENGGFLIRVDNLVNKTHKINGKNITYTTTVDNLGYYVFPRLSYVGDNKKNLFKVPNIIFYMDAEPSYNLGEDEPDNSLLLYMSGVGTSKEFKITSSCGGKGRLIKTLTGALTGTLGCGCTAYGHKSPTRVAGELGPTDEVTDVAAVYGTWKASFNQDYDEDLVIEQ